MTHLCIFQRTARIRVQDFNSVLLQTPPQKKTRKSLKNPKETKNPKSGEKFAFPHLAAKIWREVKKSGGGALFWSTGGGG